MQVEANRLLEVDLDRSALILSLQCIVDLAVDFGSVEGAIAMVESPGQSRVIQSQFKCRFSLIPKLVTSQSVLWSRRKLQLESESEDGVDVFQEVESVLNLLLNLLFGAENVSIVLLESPDTNKTAKGTGDLISM